MGCDGLSLTDSYFFIFKIPRMNLIFATHNNHKLKEIQDIVSQATSHTISSLTDLDLHEPIPETGVTLEENALIKARFVWQHFGKSCFSDDTGLEVDALGGAPGVWSARYAGEGCSYSDNVNLLLRNMAGISNRKARFRTVVALIIDGHEYLFDGIVEGSILIEPTGEGGFGYDPVFLPDGFHESFAEMTSVLKNSISHRGRAMGQLISFLTTLK